MLDAPDSKLALFLIQSVKTKKIFFERLGFPCLSIFAIYLHSLIVFLRVPKGSGVPGVLKGRLFKVGIYYNGIYSWDFETELKEYI